MTRRAGGARTPRITTSTIRLRTRICSSLLTRVWFACCSSTLSAYSAELHAFTDLPSFCREKRACGVEYVTENQFGSKISTAYASRLVVLSSGAFGTPAILERSGVGSAQLLERLDIPVLVDLPGVGEDYQGMRPSYPLTALRGLVVCALSADCVFHRSSPYARQISRGRLYGNAGRPAQRRAGGNRLLAKGVRRGRKGIEGN